MRTTKGPARNRAKNRLFKRVKGYRGGRGRLLRTAKETLVRAEASAYRDRRARKREFRKLWIIRINAAVRQRGLRYSDSLFKFKWPISEPKYISDKDDSWPDYHPK